MPWDECDCPILQSVGVIVSPSPIWVPTENGACKDVDRGFDVTIPGGLVGVWGEESVPRVGSIRELGMVVWWCDAS